MKIKKRLVLLIGFIELSFNFLQAVPPFITDDPSPVPQEHGELYFGFSGTKSNSESYVFLPFAEVDYGAFKDTQLHAVVPLALDKKSGKGYNYGPGAIELGVKYRFVHESKKTPQIGTFPLIELPTGNSRLGLGNGKTQIFLPLWIQKHWGKKGREWTVYGGGGYWFNPGKGNKDYCFLGLVVQKEFNKTIWAGLETFFQTKYKIDKHDSFGFNFGGGINLRKNLQLTYALGANTGVGQFLYCAALYYKW